MEKVRVNSSQAEGRKDSLDVGGCGESGDSGIFSSDDEDGAGLDWVVSEGGLVTGVQVDRVDVVNKESRDFDSGISLTVQTSVLGESSSAGTAINGVDFGVLVSVHIFCSCVSWSLV